MARLEDTGPYREPNRTTNKKSGEQRSQVRYYIYSVEPDAALIDRAVRAHWSVEKLVILVFGCVFGEDYSTKQARNAAENFQFDNEGGLGPTQRRNLTQKINKGKEA